MLERTQSDCLRLTLLGRFAASTGGAAPRMVQISAPRHRILLAYLAMQPTYTETRERLATLLWSDRPDKQARQSLRQLLFLLKQELEAAGITALRIARDAIGLDPALVLSDARELLKLAQFERIEDAERIADLDYAPFLEAVTIESESFDEWVRAERARLASLAIGLFQQGAERLDAAGQGAAAVRAAERMVAVDPLREASHRMLLRLLARHRGRDAALAHAERLARLLGEEVGADPDAETAALIAEIAAQAAGEPATRPIERADPRAPFVFARTAAPDVASDPGPSRAEPAHPQPPRRRRIWPAAGWAVGGLGAVAIMLGLAAGPEAPTNAPPDGAPVQSAATEANAANGWRTPSILAGVSADGPALAGQVAYPIVVLPFTAENRESREEQRAADRIGDDLIGDLSRVPGLRVIARGTSRLYAGRAIDVAAVGAELGVRYVIEGTVRLADGRLRIDAALVDPTTRLQVWSERFERPEADRIAAHDEMVRSIARHLNVTVFAAEEGRRGPPRAGDPAIDALLAKGWNGLVHFFELGTTSGADDHFQQVLRRQPNNISAMLGLAGYKIAAVAQFLVPEREPFLTEADALISTVLAKNPNSHFGTYYRGLLYKVRGEPQQALAQFAKVLAMNPSFAPAYANAGHVMSRAGQLEEAIEHVRYAIRLSPKDPSLGHWNLYAGEIELERGRDAAALEWLKRAVEAHPRSPFNHAALAATLALSGDQDGAARHAARLRELAPWLTLDVMLERLAGTTSVKESEPRRLVEGLRRAFAAGG